MHHQGQLQFCRYFLGPAQRRKAQIPVGFLPYPDFQARNFLRIFFLQPPQGRQIEIRRIYIFQLRPEARQPGGTDVEENPFPHPGIHQPRPQQFIIGAACTARIIDRCHPRRKAECIRRNADGGKGRDMGMGINQAGGDDAAPGVHIRSRQSAAQIPHSGNFSILHGHIRNFIPGIFRIDHPAAPDDQFICFHPYSSPIIL